ENRLPKLKKELKAREKLGKTIDQRISDPWHKFEKAVNSLNWAMEMWGSAYNQREKIASFQSKFETSLHHFSQNSKLRFKI
ncbi:hypothetical protein EWB00_007053, partial [Schistosoma japonicum]